MVSTTRNDGILARVFEVRPCSAHAGSAASCSISPARSNASSGRWMGRAGRVSVPVVTSFIVSSPDMTTPGPEGPGVRSSTELRTATGSRCRSGFRARSGSQPLGSPSPRTRAGAACGVRRAARRDERRERRHEDQQELPHLTPLDTTRPPTSQERSRSGIWVTRGRLGWVRWHARVPPAAVPCGRLTVDRRQRGLLGTRAGTRRSPAAPRSGGVRRHRSDTRVIALLRAARHARASGHAAATTIAQAAARGRARATEASAQESWIDDRAGAHRAVPRRLTRTLTDHGSTRTSAPCASSNGCSR